VPEFGEFARGRLRDGRSASQPGHGEAASRQRRMAQAGGLCWLEPSSCGRRFGVGQSRLHQQPKIRVAGADCPRPRRCLIELLARPACRGFSAQGQHRPRWPGPRRPTHWLRGGQMGIATRPDRRRPGPQDPEIELGAIGFQPNWLTSPDSRWPRSGCRGRNGWCRHRGHRIAPTWHRPDRAARHEHRTGSVSKRSLSIRSGSNC